MFREHHSHIYSCNLFQLAINLSLMPSVHAHFKCWEVEKRIRKKNLPVSPEPKGLTGLK